MTRTVVWALRRWIDGPRSQQEVWAHFSMAIGTTQGCIALKAFEAFLHAVVRHRTRVLNKHLTNCPCMGEDEAMLGLIVENSAIGDWSAARAAAAGIIAPDGLECVLKRAAELGLRLRETRIEPPACSRREMRITLKPSKTRH